MQNVSQKYCTYRVFAQPGMRGGSCLASITTCFIPAEAPDVTQLCLTTCFSPPPTPKAYLNFRLVEIGEQTAWRRFRKPTSRDFFWLFHQEIEMNYKILVQKATNIITMDDYIS